MAQYKVVQKLDLIKVDFLDKENGIPKSYPEDGFELLRDVSIHQEGQRYSVHLTQVPNEGKSDTKHIWAWEILSIIH